MRDKLTALFRSLTQDVHTFKPGDIVEWKPHMDNKLSKGPFIITEILEEPIFGNNHDSGSPYYREPLDCKAGKIAENGDFIEHHYDSRRFQLAK